MQSKLLRSLLLFFGASILMQVYYLVNTWLDLWSEYFPWGYIIHIVFYISIFAITIFFVGKPDLDYLGIKFVNLWRRYILMGLIFVLFHYAVRILVTEGTFNRIYPIRPEIYVPAFIFLGLLVGLSEESAFRGYIQKNILEAVKDAGVKESYKPTIAILMSSLLFGVYHVYFVGSGNAYWWALYILQAFTAGIFMGFLYFETGCNLLGPITYHSTNVIVGNTIPWMATSSPYYQLTIATIINVVQTLILIGFSKIPKSIQRKCL